PLQVPLAKNAHVMRHMPRGYVCECPHCERVPARDPALRPRLVRQVAEEIQRRLADRAELRHEVAQRTLIEAHGRDRDVLIEAWQLPGKPTCKPERTEHEHALTVVDVANDLANAPLVGGIAMERLLLRDPAEHRDGLPKLRVDDTANVLALGNLVDVRDRK